METKKESDSDSNSAIKKNSSDFLESSDSPPQSERSFSTNPNHIKNEIDSDSKSAIKKNSSEFLESSDSPPQSERSFSTNPHHNKNESDNDSSLAFKNNSSDYLESSDSPAQSERSFSTNPIRIKNNSDNDSILAIKNNSSDYLKSSDSPAQSERSFSTNPIHTEETYDLSKGGLIFSMNEQETDSKSPSDGITVPDSSSNNPVEIPLKRKIKHRKHTSKNSRKKSQKQYDDLFICSEQSHFLKYHVPNIFNPYSLKDFYAPNHTYFESCEKALQEYSTLDECPQELPDSELLQNIHQYSQALFASSSLGRANMEKFPLSSLISFGVLAEELVKHEVSKLPTKPSNPSPEFKATKLCAHSEVLEEVNESFQVLGETVHPELVCSDSDLYDDSLED